MINCHIRDFYASTEKDFERLKEFEFTEITRKLMKDAV